MIEYKNNSAKGFTLIEVMIVVAVIALLATLAVPAYQSQKRKGLRVEAINAMTKIQNELQRCYSRLGGYDCCNESDDSDLTKENVLGAILPNNPLTISGNYTISITFSSVDATQFACKQAQGYNLTASLATGTDQYNDSCASFTIDALGNRTALDKTSTLKSSCWSDR